MINTGDQSFLKSINRIALLRLVRTEPGLSRADLAELTGLTKSTVSLLVQGLIDEGWLTEDHILATGSLGRRPVPLKTDETRLALVGLDLRAQFLRLVATTLSGEVLASTHCTLPLELADHASITSERVQLLLDAMAEQLRELMLAVQQSERKIVAVGLALPGLVRPIQKHRHEMPSEIMWRNVAVCSEIRNRLQQRGVDAPVFAERRISAAVLAEVEFAQQKLEEPFVFIHLGRSVGAGVFFAGKVLNGRGGLGGDIGHLQLALDGPVCRCGGKGCVNAFIGLEPMAAKLGVSLEVLTAHLVEDGEAQDPAFFERLQPLLDEAAPYLAMLLHNLWVSADPVQIVLGGPSIHLGARFLDAAVRLAQDKAESMQQPMPPVRLSRFGAQVIPIGAAAMALHSLLYPA